MSKRQMAESKCKNCRAPILWATQSTGGRIPLNIATEKVSAVTIGPLFFLNEIDMICLKADLSMIEHAIEDGRSLFSNHLVTCDKRNAERNAA